jgi:catechol 2,3-dioxygenase-like lactoylglutathione lyase family enzyme
MAPERWSLELVFAPVSDVDRAKAFYRDQLGFVEDFDSQLGDVVRMVQLTPPGSACSIALMTGMSPGPGLEDMEPGSLHGLQIVVPDLKAARAQLIEKGVDVSEIMEAVHEKGRSVYRATEEARGWNAYASSTTRTAMAGSCRKA